MEPEDVAPRVLEEPGQGGSREWDDVWMRGLWMLVLAVLFGLGTTLLTVGVVLQFGWLLFAKEKNAQIAAFGEDLAEWLAQVALFLAGTTEDKPFPFSPWGRKG